MMMEMLSGSTKILIVWMKILMGKIWRRRREKGTEQGLGTTD